MDSRIQVKVHLDVVYFLRRDRLTVWCCFLIASSCKKHGCLIIIRESVMTLPELADITVIPALVTPGFRLSTAIEKCPEIVFAANLQC